MRWEALFADLSAQLDTAEAQALAGEVADRTRREVAQLRLQDRLAPLAGCPVHVQVLGAGAVLGTLLDAGPDWALVAEAGGRRVVVPLAAVAWVGGLSRLSTAPGTEGKVASRLTLAYVLRGLARDRAAVTLVLRDGGGRGGTLDRVGRDYVELAEHPAGEPRRAASVSGVIAVPFAALALIRSA
jgi:hypothetical protein